jgi:acetyl esterase/lipase
MISQEAKNIMAFMSQMKIPNLRDVPIELCRQGMAGMMAFSLPPLGCRMESVNAGGVPALWITAANSDTEAKEAVFYLHGGAYSMCSPQTHLGLTGLLSELSGVQVLSVDYRLAPEHPYPAAIEDAICAYQWILAQGIPACSLVIGGDSAGGGLAFATLLELRRLNIDMPAAAFAISPWVDLTHTGETMKTKADEDPMFTEAGMDYMARLYANGADLRSPLISPLYADLRGLPPVLIHVGTSEMLLSDARRMADALQKAGVNCTLKEWEGLFHVFHSAVYLPEARVANEEIAAFVRKHIRGN